MKTLMVLLLCICFFAQGQQKTDSLQQMNATLPKYEKQWKHRTKVGRILAIAGATLVVSGVIVQATDNDKDHSLISERTLTALALEGSGLLAALTSVPFFIAGQASKNKMLSLQPVVQWIPNEATGKSQPVVGINLKF